MPSRRPTSTPTLGPLRGRPVPSPIANDEHFGHLYRLAMAAEHEDDVSDGHPARVGRTAMAIAGRMGLGGFTAAWLVHAAPLHDVGKLAIPESILHKPGPLTVKEFEVVKFHTTAGGALLGGGGSRLLSLAREIALTHHERWDGRGYPDGLAGDQIPLSGRIVALADVFDALTHARPYKDAWSIDQAIAEIRRQRGRHFDPDVVDAFLNGLGEVSLATPELTLVS